jgi:hypothetical protein
MFGPSTFFSRAARLRAMGAGLILLGPACADESGGPSAPADLPEEVAAAPLETTIADAVLDNRSSRPGIVFGTFNMRNEYLSSVHNGWMNGGPLDPSNILS